MVHTEAEVHMLPDVSMFVMLLFTISMPKQSVLFTHRSHAPAQHLLRDTQIFVI
jgi:hypothetical protein